MNPFLTTHKFDLDERIKIAFFILSGIAPLKFIMFTIFALLTAITLYLCFIGYKKNKEISKIRRYFLYIPQIFAYLTLLSLGYFNISENINKFNKFNYLERKNAPKLIISNHVSFIDSLYFLTRGIPSIVTVPNVLKIPFAGFAIKKMEPIIVPITKKEKEELPNVKEQITNRLMNTNLSRPLLIFPEGGTKNSNYLLKFQNGAFMNNISYQPILLKYKYKYLDPSWTLDSGTFKLIFLMCCQFINNLEVTYLEPCNLSKDEIRQIYINKLNVIDSNLSNHDNLFLRKNLDKMDYIFEHVYIKKYNIEYFNKKYNLNHEKMHDLVNEFYKCDKFNNGTIITQDVNAIFNKLNLVKKSEIKENIITFNQMIESLV